MLCWAGFAGFAGFKRVAGRVMSRSFVRLSGRPGRHHTIYCIYISISAGEPGRIVSTLSSPNCGPAGRSGGSRRSRGRARRPDRHLHNLRGFASLRENWWV